MSPTNFLAELEPCMVDDAQNRASLFLPVDWFCLEDEFGLVNVIVRPALHERQRSLVRTEPFVVVSGELQRRDGTVNVVAKELRPLRTGTDLAPEAHNFG